MEFYYSLRKFYKCFYLWIGRNSWINSRTNTIVCSITIKLMQSLIVKRGHKHGWKQHLNNKSDSRIIICIHFWRMVISLSAGVWLNKYILVQNDLILWGSLIWQILCGQQIDKIKSLQLRASKFYFESTGNTYRSGSEFSNWSTCLIVLSHFEVIHEIKSVFFFFTRELEQGSG